MKSLLTFITLLLTTMAFAQSRRDTISLSLELVNPNGVIDKKTYFKATLKNDTPDFHAFLSDSRLFDGCFDRMGRMKIEIEHKDGTIEESSENPIFVFYEKRVLVIEPGASIEGNVLLRDELGLGYGLVGPIPNLSKLQSYKRIRIKLVSYISGFKRVNGDLQCEFYDNLCSNWVDLSECDFSRIARPDK